MTFLMYLCLGAVAGLLAGLLGIGGGLIVVPVLMYAFQAEGVTPDVIPHLAVGTSLTTMIVTSAGSTLEHHRNGGVRWGIMAYLGGGMAVGSIGGVVIAGRLSGALLTGLIGVFAIAMAFQMAFGFKPKPGAGRPRRSLLAGTGLLIGGASAMFGIGGGTLTVPFLTWRQVEPRQAVGTSAACGLPIAVVGGLTNIVTGWNTPGLPDWSTGYVYWPALLGVVLMSPIFAQMGAKLAYKAPAHVLKRVFAILLVAVGINFLRKSYYSERTSDPTPAERDSELTDNEP